MMVSQKGVKVLLAEVRDLKAKLERVEKLAGKDGVRHLSPHMALQEIRGIIRGDVVIHDQS